MKMTQAIPDFLFIQLGGALEQRTKDDCENIRLREQIWATFRQFGGFERYNIYLDAVRLGDLINTDR